MTINDMALVSIVLVSQSAATVRFWRMLNKGYIPPASDFAALSCLLFYGVPLLFGSFFARTGLFVSIFSLDFEKQWLVALIVAAAPWVIRVASIGNTHIIRKHGVYVRQLNPQWRFVFYCFAVVSCTFLCYVSLSPLLEGASIGMLKEISFRKWGAFIIVFSLPVPLLAFYVMQEESRSSSGCIFLLFLFVVAFGSTFPQGERTYVLLPLLILGIFWIRAKVILLTTYGCALMVFASLLLPVLKPGLVFSEKNHTERMIHVIGGDLARMPVLAKVIDVAEPVGTTVMPYTGAGYVYSLLFFIPRRYAPFKGYSTANMYTAYLTGDDSEYMNWGVGLGAMEEILLNFGWIFLLPGLFIYGKILAFLDRKCLQIPVLVIPKSLMGVWMFGYHVPSLLQLFGFMAAVMVLMSLLFNSKSNTIELQTLATSSRIRWRRNNSLEVVS